MKIAAQTHTHTHVLILFRLIQWTVRDARRRQYKWRQSVQYVHWPDIADDDTPQSVRAQCNAKDTHNEYAQKFTPTHISIASRLFQIYSHLTELKLRIFAEFPLLSHVFQQQFWRKQKLSFREENQFAVIAFRKW